MSIINRRLRLKTRPEGLVQRENFDLVDEAVPELKDGEVLPRMLYMSMDRPIACGFATSRNTCHRWRSVR